MRRLAALASRRGAYVVLGLVLAGLLAYGSVHPGPAGASARVAALESVIKCPSCADVSIAQSDAAVARQLRASVMTWVAAGRSDAWIEDAVVARYGPGILLRPRSVWLFVGPALAIGLAIGALAVTLARRRHRGGEPGSAVGSLDPDDELLVAAALDGVERAWATEHDEGGGR